MSDRASAPQEGGRSLLPLRPNAVANARVTRVGFTVGVTAKSPTTPIVRGTNLKPIRQKPLPLLHHVLIMNHRRHTSTMSLPENPPRDRNYSPTGSFKSALSTIKRAATNTSTKSAASYTPGDDAVLSIPLDDLPNDPRALEGLLNRHLSALDQLARTVDARNAEIKDYCTRAAHFYNLKPRVSNQFLRQLDVEIQVLRSQRNGLQGLVKMRWDEIVRIAEHRKGLDESRGLQCTVYEMYLGYRKVREWEERMSI